MKKIKLALVLGSLAAGTSFAQSVSLTNTFGGNTNDLSGKDFLIFNKDFEKEDVHVSDRLQLDVASDKLDGRIRLDLNGSGNIDGKNTTIQTRGYVNFRPVNWLNFILSNKNFSKWGISGAYLTAVDDYPTTGKLADDNGAHVVFNSNGFQAAAGAGYESSLDLNFGAAYTAEDKVSIGATAHNVTSSDVAAYSIYGALLSVENLKLNAGYSYNYNGGYLSNTKHALQLSSSYNIKDSGLSFYGDFIIGLSSEYYSTATDKVEDYKDSDGNKFIPVYAAFRTSWKANDELLLNAKIIVNQAQSAGDKVTATSVYPYFDYKTAVGTFRTGARFQFDSKDGYTGFSIPLSWIYKFKIK